MNNENENKRTMERMKVEIDALTEAKVAIEKAEEAVRKAGTICEWLYGHAEEKFTLKNMAQKYEAEISQRAKLSSAAECLMKMGIEIGSPFSFSKKAKAVFDVEGMHIVLHMLLSQDYSDRDYDYIIKHVIGIIAGSAGIDLPKADCIENSTGEEIEALAAILTGQKEYAELKAEAADRVDGVLSII